MASGHKMRRNQMLERIIFPFLAQDAEEPDARENHFSLPAQDAEEPDARENHLSLPAQDAEEPDAQENHLSLPAQDAEEPEARENHLSLLDENIKVLTKGQKKHLQESLTELEQQDSALWSTVSQKPRQPKKMMPRGCKSFIFELFAGAATLTILAAQAGMPVSTPVDIQYDPAYDLLNPSNRAAIGQRIQEEDPFLLSITPVCGPWSVWQNVNLAKGGDTAEFFMHQRKLRYPVVKWVCDLVRSRLSKGREVMLENPWGSLIWRLLCMEKLIDSQPYNVATSELL